MDILIRVGISLLTDSRTKVFRYRQKDRYQVLTNCMTLSKNCGKVNSLSPYDGQKAQIIFVCHSVYILCIDLKNKNIVYIFKNTASLFFMLYLSGV